jgi:hypothetical protein
MAKEPTITNKAYNALSIFVYNKMSQSDWFTSYLEYLTLEDMLKVILYSSQSMFTIVPMLYHINYNNKHILFIQTGMVGGVVVHYIIQEKRPEKKFVKLNKLSGHFTFLDNIRDDNDTQAIYIPILELRRSTLHFPD